MLLREIDVLFHVARCAAAQAGRQVVGIEAYASVNVGLGAVGLALEPVTLRHQRAELLLEARRVLLQMLGQQDAAVVAADQLLHAAVAGQQQVLAVVPLIDRNAGADDDVLMPVRRRVDIETQARADGRAVLAHGGGVHALALVDVGVGFLRLVGLDLDELGDGRRVGQLLAMHDALALTGAMLALDPAVGGLLGRTHAGLACGGGIRLRRLAQQQGRRRGLTGRAAQTFQARFQTGVSRQRALYGGLVACIPVRFFVGIEIRRERDQPVVKLAVETRLRKVRQPLRQAQRVLLQKGAELHIGGRHAQTRIRAQRAKQRAGGAFDIAQGDDRFRIGGGAHPASAAGSASLCNSMMRSSVFAWPMPELFGYAVTLPFGA